MRRLLCGSTVLSILLGLQPATAQQQSDSRGQFDGTYTDAHISCIPANSNTRWGATTIRNSRISIGASSGARNAQGCAADVKADGSFRNDECRMPLKGKVTGDKLEFSFKHPDMICDVSATREKPGPFDGLLYTDPHIECDPPRANLRWQNMTIARSRFSMRVTRSSGSGSCELEVMTDGTFRNDDCEVPTVGRVTGSKLDFSYRFEATVCKVSLTRQN
jgi:hypothetical protein